jgi:ABC-type nitrate/sulfonate/bicarbonate transport system ATPase subunit
VVVFKNVTKSFKEAGSSRVAIQDICFAVEDAPNIGELVTIVGPSGCGKSTLLRIIAGLKPHFPPTKGEVHVFGKPVQEAGPDRGLVDQKYSLLPHLNVIENVAFGLKLRGTGRSERRDRAQDWIKKVGLEGSERKYPSELSGGMQQRVAIAATLILQPRILLMDEPFGALDPGIRLRMQELLIKLWSEQEETVFLVTHSVEEAVYLGDRVFLMAAKPGRLVEVLKVPRPAEPPEESRRKPWFIDFCQALLRRLEEESPVPPGVKV